MVASPSSLYLVNPQKLNGLLKIEMDASTEWRALRRQYQAFLGPGSKVVQTPPQEVSFAAPNFDLAAMRSLRLEHVLPTQEQELVRYSQQKSVKASLDPGISPRTTSDRPSYPSAIIESSYTDSMEMRSKSRLEAEDSLHLSPAMSSNVTISDADTFRSPSLSQTLSQSQGLLSLPFETKRSGGLLSPPLLQGNASYRSSESEPRLSQRESARFVSDPPVQPFLSPTGLLSVPIELPREAATPHFSKKSPASSSPPSSTVAPFKVPLTDWLLKEPTHLSRPVSEGADMKNSQESQQSAKTDGQRLKDHHAFVDLEESSIDLKIADTDSDPEIDRIARPQLEDLEESKNSPPPSFLQSPSPYDISLSALSPVPAVPPASLPATARTASLSSEQRAVSCTATGPRQSYLSFNEQQPASATSLISSPSLGQLQQLKIGELIANSAEPLKFVGVKDSLESMSDYKEDLTELKSGRVSCLFAATERAIESGQNHYLRLAYVCLVRNMREKFEESLIVQREKEDKSMRFYNERLIFRAFQALFEQKIPVSKLNLALEFRYKRQFLRLHQYFSGFRKVSRAHKVWILEVQRGFAWHRLE